MKILISIVSSIALVTGGFTGFAFYANKKYVEKKKDLEDRIVSLEKRFFKLENPIVEFEFNYFLNEIYLFYEGFYEKTKKTAAEEEMDFLLSIEQVKEIVKISKNLKFTSEKEYDFDFFFEENKQLNSETFKKKMDELLALINGGRRGDYKIVEKAAFNDYLGYGNLLVSEIGVNRIISNFDYFINLKNKINLIFLSNKEEREKIISLIKKTEDFLNFLSKEKKLTITEKERKKYDFVYEICDSILKKINIKFERLLGMGGDNYNYISIDDESINEEGRESTKIIKSRIERMLKIEFPNDDYAEKFVLIIKHCYFIRFFYNFLKQYN